MFDMIIDNGSRMMRWRLLARLPRTGRDAAHAELRLQAKRTADVESTSDCADDILVVDDMQWYLPTKREAHDFLRQLPIPGVETRSLPMPNRMLQD